MRVGSPVFVSTRTKNMLVMTSDASVGTVDSALPRQLVVTPSASFAFRAAACARTIRTSLPFLQAVPAVPGQLLRLPLTEKGSTSGGAGICASL